MALQECVELAEHLEGAFQMTSDWEMPLWYFACDDFPFMLKYQVTVFKRDFLCVGGWGATRD